MFINQVSSILKGVKIVQVVFMNSIFSMYSLIFKNFLCLKFFNFKNQKMGEKFLILMNMKNSEVFNNYTSRLSLISKTPCIYNEILMVK